MSVNKNIQIIEEIGVAVTERTLHDAPQPAKYAYFRACYPEWTKDQCKVAAGYSIKTPTAQIEKTNTYKLAQVRIDKSVTQQRLELQSTPGFSLKDSAVRYKNIASNEQVDPKTRVQAQHRSDELMGHKAPQEIHQTTRSLLMEFKDLTGDDLAILRDALV